MAPEKVISVSSPDFSDMEEAILKELYEVADGSHNLYSLVTRVHPEVKAGGDAAQKAFEEVRDTFEGLVVRGIVAGKRLTGTDGVYFDKLRLTAKGECKAIQSKNRPREIRLNVQFIEPKKKNED